MEPRWLALAPNGDVFVADARAGRILVLRDSHGSGRADRRFVFASGLKQPFGMAFWHEYLYVGNTNAVVRFRYRPGHAIPSGWHSIPAATSSGLWSRSGMDWETTCLPIT